MASGLIRLKRWSGPGALTWVEARNSSRDQHARSQTSACQLGQELARRRKDAEGTWKSMLTLTLLSLFQLMAPVIHAHRRTWALRIQGSLQMELAEPCMRHRSMQVGMLTEFSRSGEFRGASAATNHCLNCTDSTMDRLPSINFLMQNSSKKVSLDMLLAVLQQVSVHAPASHRHIEF